MTALEYELEQARHLTGCVRIPHKDYVLQRIAWAEAMHALKTADPEAWKRALEIERGGR